MMPLLGRSLRRALLLSLLCVALTTLALSVWGVLVLGAQDPVFLGDTLLRSVQLLTFRLPLQLVAEVPLSVRAAQWGVLLTVVLLILVAGMGLLRRPLTDFVASRQRGHLLFSGEGVPAQLALTSFTQSRHRIVWLRDRAYAAAHPAAEFPRVIELHGDAADERTLVKASLPRAAAFVILGESDERNLAVAATTERLCEERRTQASPLRCIVEIGQESLRRSLQGLRPIIPGRRVERRFYFRDRTIVRLLMREYPLDASADVVGGQRVHVLILSWGEIAEQILLHILNLGHYDENGPRVTILDRDARDCERVLCGRYPQIDQIGRINFQPWDEAVGSQAMGDLLTQTTDEPFTAIYLCDARWRRSLEVLRALQLAAQAQLVSLPPIYVYARESKSLLEAVCQDMGVLGMPRVVPFGPGDELYSQENFLEEALDKSARAVHENYLETLRQQGQDLADRPAGVPWDRLPESYRDASRYQADHAEIKLRRIGFTIASLGVQGRNSLTNSEVEMLATMEHLRWMADRHLEGWTYAKKRDDRRRQTPYLVPYEALSEEVKEYDRKPARRLPELLASAGLAAQREFTVGVVGHVGHPAGGSQISDVVGELLASLRKEAGDRRLVLVSPLLEYGSQAVVSACLASHEAWLRVIVALPAELLAAELEDRRRCLAFQGLLGRAQRIFTLALTEQERAAKKRGDALGPGPAERLAAWLVVRSERLVLVHGASRSPADSLAAGVVENCIAATRDRPEAVIELGP